MKNLFHILKQWSFVLCACSSSLYLSAQDIALNKLATASSVENSTLTANKAVDGITTTRWASGQPWKTPEWIYVDLGATYSVNRVVLNWETAYANGYQVQVSNNTSSWTTIFTTSTGNGGTDDLTGLSGTGRYVRVYATSRGTSYGFSLFEFKVYGTSTVPPTGISLTVNKSSLKQTIEGFGFFGPRDNWWSSNDPSYFYTDAWLNLIVNDLGITMWRNEIYPHNPPSQNTTANQDANWDKQRPFVQALKAKADALGVDLKIILTVWTPPGALKWQSSFTWAGDPNATRGPTAQGDFYSEKNGGTLNPNKYSAFATWLTQAVQMYKNAGITPYAISPQNEPLFVEPYNSCTYTTYWYRDMIKGVIPQVKSAHPGLKVFGSENMLELEGADNNYPYFYHTTLKNDATAMGLIDRIAVHGYSNGVNPSSGSTLAQYWTRHKTEFSAPFNKPEWMTETSGYVDTWESSGGKPGAFNLALDMHAALYYGDLAGWLWWSGSGDPGSTDAIGEFQLMHGTTVGKKYYASKQFYRYIRPGARRMDTNSPDSNLFVTAYYHAGNNTHTVVILNTATTSKTVSITGSNLPASYDMYVTSASQNNQLTTNVSANGITLPPRSIVTLQAGGTPLAGTSAAKSAAPKLTTLSTENVKSNAVFLYPNPLRSGKLTVGIYSDKREEAVLTLLDATSQPVLEMKRSLVKGNNVFSVAVEGASNGLYFLRIRQGNVQIMKKVIVQK
jgi:O-glycosyl hydrolase